MAKEKPAHKVRLGYVTATVWKNGEYYSVVLSRSYKDAEDKWQETDNLAHGDVLNAIKVLERAENWISQQE